MSERYRICYTRPAWGGTTLAISINADSEIEAVRNLLEIPSFTDTIIVWCRRRDDIWEQCDLFKRETERNLS